VPVRALPVTDVPRGHRYEGGAPGRVERGWTSRHTSREVRPIRCLPPKRFLTRTADLFRDRVLRRRTGRGHVSGPLNPVTYRRVSAGMGHADFSWPTISVTILGTWCPRGPTPLSCPRFLQLRFSRSDSDRRNTTGTRRGSRHGSETERRLQPARSSDGAHPVRPAETPRRRTEGPTVAALVPHRQPARNSDGTDTAHSRRPHDGDRGTSR
jgi:hypothetical protein